MFMYVCMFIFKESYSKELADVILEVENPMLCGEEAVRGQALRKPIAQFHPKSEGLRTRRASGASSSPSLNPKSANSPLL